MAGLNVRDPLGGEGEASVEPPASGGLSGLAPSLPSGATQEGHLAVSPRGRGFSIIQFDGEPEERVEWAEGTLFSPPVFAWHQHINLTEDEPARYLAIQDTRLKRHLRMHQIERDPIQPSLQLFLEASVNSTALGARDDATA